MKRVGFSMKMLITMLASFLFLSFSRNIRGWFYVYNTTNKPLSLVLFDCGGGLKRLDPRYRLPRAHCPPPRPSYPAVISETRMDILPGEMGRVHHFFGEGPCGEYSIGTDCMFACSDRETFMGKQIFTQVDDSSHPRGLAYIDRMSVKKLVKDEELLSRIDILYDFGVKNLGKYVPIDRPITEAITALDKEIVNYLEYHPYAPGVLYEYVRRGNFAQAKKLLASNKVDVNDKMPDTPLSIAIKKNQPELVQILIDKGADINIATRGGMHALKLAYEQPDGQEIMRIILKKLKEDKSLEDRALWRFMYAIDLGVTKVLLENGADPNLKMNDEPILITAVIRDSRDMVKLLLEYGADINATDKEGRTAWLVAVTKGRVAIADLLSEWAEKEATAPSLK